MAETARPWLRPPPPPPDASILSPEVVAELRRLRLRFNSDSGGGSTHRQSRNAYDHLLVEVADVMEIAGAPAPDLVIGRRVLTILERALLEKALVAAGVDLGIDDRPRLRAIGPAPHSNRPRSWPTDHARAAAQATPAPAPAAPPPAPPAPPPDPRRELNRRARAMRRRLDTYERDDRLWPTKVDEWCEDLDTYDSVLVELATMVGLPRSALPAGERRRLLSEERDAIEAGLARAGLGVTGSPAGS